VSACELPEEWRAVLTIDRLEIVQLETPSGAKSVPALYCAGHDKPLDCPAAVGRRLIAALGRDTDRWPGATVELYRTRVRSFGGEQVAAIRCGPITPPPGGGREAPK